MIKPATEEVITKANNELTYAFEGRYWVEYGEYANAGYYFDGISVCIDFNLITI